MVIPSLFLQFFEFLDKLKSLLLRCIQLLLQHNDLFVEGLVVFAELSPVLLRLRIFKRRHLQPVLQTQHLLLERLDLRLQVVIALLLERQLILKLQLVLPEPSIVFLKPQRLALGLSQPGEHLMNLSVSVLLDL